MIIKNNFNDLYLSVIKDVLNTGTKSSPRGFNITEKIFYSFELSNPLNCLCTIKERKLNYAFTIIEKLEYLSGINNPERLCFYNNNMRNYINNNTNEFDGSYGPRIGRQINYIYNLLKDDNDTRQAVININNENDKHVSKDIPCTVSLQFLLRNNKLNLIVYMRSNDLMFGVPYDINAFCFLQEVMAKWLNVKIGNYYHIAGSMHIYDNTRDKLDLLLNDNITFVKNKNPIFDINSFEDTFYQLSIFWSYEEDYRKGIFNNEHQDIKSNALKKYLNIIKNYCQKKYEHI